MSSPSIPLASTAKPSPSPRTLRAAPGVDAPTSTQVGNTPRYHRFTDMPGLVLCEAKSSRFRFPPHYHLDYHVGLLAEGALRQRSAGQETMLRPGCISLMPPGQVHDGTGEDERPYSLSTFRLSTALWQDLFEDITCLAQMPAFAESTIEDGLLSARLLRLHAAMSNGAAETEPLGTQSELLLLIGRLFERTARKPPPHVANGLPPADLRRCQEYCRARLHERIVLADLAGLCGMSRFQFIRRFKQSTNITPYAWLTRLRLEQACTLLNRGRITVAQVASDVGFYDQSHFVRAFRQAFGVVPSRY